MIPAPVEAEKSIKSVVEGNNIGGKEFFALVICTHSGTSLLETYLTDIAGYWKCNIVAGQDPYLYGEKVKAYLISGAAQPPSMSDYPNPQLGWGALCVKDSLPKQSAS